MIGKSVSRNSIVLGIFAVITTGMIVLTANLTKGKIAEAQENALKQKLFEVMPKSLIGNDLLKDQVQLDADHLLGSKHTRAAYIARKDGNASGVIMQVTAPEGYGGSINLLVGINTNGDITGGRVVPPLYETPGLGDNILLKKSPWILGFDGKSLANTSTKEWHVKKDGGEFDSFAGATITPRAVVDAVHKALLYFNQHKQEILKANGVALASPREDDQHGG